jgi:hypothetical protein
MASVCVLIIFSKRYVSVRSDRYVRRIRVVGLWICECELNAQRKRLTLLLTFPARPVVRVGRLLPPQQSQSACRLRNLMRSTVGHEVEPWHDLHHNGEAFLRKRLNLYLFAIAAVSNGLLCLRVFAIWPFVVIAEHRSFDAFVANHGYHYVVDGGLGR